MLDPLLCEERVFDPSALVDQAIALSGREQPVKSGATRGDWLYDQAALQHFLLSVAQDSNGGLFCDKPGMYVGISLLSLLTIPFSL